jgi:uncharacterized membrane protein YgaE (UPF0421/DUF939 family)
MLYRTIRELPIHNFNECDLFNEYTYLIKEKDKEYTEEELIEHWDKLYEDYRTTIKDKSHIFYYQDYLKLQKLELEFNILLSIHYLKNELISISEESEKILNDILSSLRISGSLSDVIDIRKSKLDREIKLFQDKYQVKRENVSGGIDDLIPYLLSEGYFINRHTTTVSEWCGIINNIKRKTK